MKTQVAEEDQKVIVRSNGTVGYVGKDIAYHMWKFGLLGRDFGYRKFYRYPNGRDCWISTAVGAMDHPHFGGVAEIYNVIDARQSEAQNTVIEALRGLGYDQQADHYTHFSYEMVALTPRCAAELGYQLSEEDKGRGLYRSLGPQGVWCKGRRSAGSAHRIGEKRSGFSAIRNCRETERAKIATQIAVGALRYFMLKFTKSSVIAFDFKEALSFEGETGPYAQYAAVRAANIFRKGGIDLDEFGRIPTVLFPLRNWQNISMAKRATKFGNCGWRRPRLPTSSTSASLPPSQLTSPSMHSNWRNFSMPSTIAIPS